MPAAVAAALAMRSISSTVLEGMTRQPEIAPRLFTLGALRGTDESAILALRTVGRAALPRNVAGQLCHAAEHAQRHARQVVQTAKVVRGS